MNTLKKILTFVLTAAILVTCFGINVSAAELLLSEDFESGLGRLSVRTGSVSVADDNGVRAACFKGKAGVTYLKTAEDEGWNGSYTASFRVRMDNWTKNGTAFSISLNPTANDHKYLINCTNQGFTLAKMEPPAQWLLKSGPTGALSVNSTKYHTVKVNFVQDKEKQSANIVVYFDGKEMINWTDTANICSYGGFMFDTSIDSNTVYVDSITFSAIGTGKTVENIGGVPTPDLNGKNYEKEATIMRDLGVLPNDDDGMWNGDRVVTRAEYVTALMRLMGYDNLIHTYTANDIFVDIPKDAEYKDSVSLAFALGILKDDYNGYFRPDSPIKYNDAIRLAVRALGYGEQAELNGGNPNGYTWVASMLKFPSKSADTPDTLKCDIARLFFRCTEVSQKEPVKWASDYVVYAKEGRTILEQADIISDEGVVTANYISNLKESAATDRETVKIDNVLYNIGTTKASDLLGCKVKFYAKANKNDTPRLLYAAIDDPKGVLEVETNDINSSKTQKGSIEYFDSEGKNKSYKIAPSVDVIKNGGLLKSYTKEDICPKNGYVRLIDNDGDRRADVVFVYDFKTLVADNISYRTGIIYDKRSTGMSILTDDADKTVDIYKDGVSTELSNLSDGDMISWYESSDKKYIYVTASSKQVSGNTDSINEGERIIGIGGKTYDLSDSFIDAINDGFELMPKTGRIYTYLIDSFGKVAAILESSYHSGSIYAYVTNAADTGVFEKQYKLKLFCQDNEWKELYLKDKVTWNGTKNVKGENVVENTLKSADGTVVPQLIEYSLNANDEIFKINTAVDRAAAPDPTDLLCLDASGEERYKNVNKSLGSQHFVSQSKIFMIPTDLSQEDFFRSVSTSALYTGSKYNADFYNEEYAVPEVVVIHTDDNYSKDPGKLKSFFVVDSIGTEINKTSGETVTFADGLYDGKASHIIFADDCKTDEFDRGDVIQFTTGKNNMVVNAAKRFDASSPTDGDDGGFNADTRLITGKIVHINRNTNLVGISIDSKDSVDKNTKWVSVSGQSVKYYLYDKKKNSVRVSKLSELEKGMPIIARLVQEQLFEIAVVSE